ncbi:MAG: hypothetical protein HF975_04510 [ANME-2 cluster archaeon]|nr:hypothetical protein [ANME-2 cluster archaeon]
MALNFDVHGESIQVWGPSAGTDGLGNPDNTWDDDKGTVQAIVAIPGVNQRDTITPAGRIATADKKVIVPSGAGIATGDRLEIDSVNYDCLGEYAAWIVRRRNVINHLEILLRKVVG